MAVIEDILLILKVRSGNKNALNTLINKYYNNIYSYIARKMGNEQIAADLTQDVFLKLVRNIHRYQITGKFSNFLFTITINTCNDYFRKKKMDYEDIDNLEETDVSHRPDNQILDNERSEMIKKGLVILSDAQRETIILRFYHDMKVKDIAKVTGVSLPTAKSRLKQAIDKLRLFFDKEGYFE
ncbi:MAG TPA: RNA polymerase sigma factor [Mobilitalea sp.]|nr:RNA polymerase sigma factor [Mobilitalea sp.]